MVGLRGERRRLVAKEQKELARLLAILKHRVDLRNSAIHPAVVEETDSYMRAWVMPLVVGLLEYAEGKRSLASLKFTRK